MLNAMDHPFMFAIVVTLIVLALAHLFHMAAKKANQPGLASFFALND